MQRFVRPLRQDALAALRGEERDDVVAGRDRGNALSDALDDSGALVPEHAGRVPARIRSRRRVQVRVADAAGDEPDERLPGLRLGEVELLDDERLPELLEHGRPDLHRLTASRRDPRNAVRVEELGVALSPERVPGLLLAVEAGRGDARVDLVDLGRALAFEGDAELVPGIAHPLRPEASYHVLRVEHEADAVGEERVDMTLVRRLGDGEPEQAVELDRASHVRGDDPDGIQRRHV